MQALMKPRLLLFILCSVPFWGCKKLVDAPRGTCFIPYVDFVAYHVDPNTLEVSFTSITSYNGTITSHYWDFGDGTTFNGEKPPPHKYPPQNASSTTNTYRIKYTVANECGEAYWTQDIKISRCLADVKFTYVMVNDSTVQFTNTTTSATPVNYEWDFGDSTKSTSSAGKVTKTYLFDGKYTVTLKATNDCGDNYFIASVPICAKPVPAQTVSLSGCATVNIDAGATKNGEAYQWDFGNGTVLPASPSSSPTISYTYPKNGSYTIKLKVINRNRCDSATTSTPVTIEAIGVVPNNNWSATSDDLEFYFSREGVINATAYSWDFGDGTSSFQQDPGRKTFSNPGVYELTLTASNSCGNYSFTSSLTAPFYKAISHAPNSPMRDVVAISAGEIYFLTAGGKLYKTDTAGNWSAAISLPPSLNFNNNTRLFKDIQNNLWIFGRNEVARFDPSNSTWVSLFGSTGFDRNTTIDGIAIDNSGDLWTVADREVHRNATKMNSSGNNRFSSIAFNSLTQTIWITATNRNDLYYVKTNEDRLTAVDVPGIAGGAGNIRVHANGDMYFTTGTGVVRVNNNGSFIAGYTALTTGGLLRGAPGAFSFDNEGNMWVVYEGGLLKIPVNASGNTKNYSFTADLNNISSAAVLQVTETDSDILLAKTTGNVAIQIK